MGQLSRVLRDAVDGGLLFWCPGCASAHQVKVGDGAGPRWGWNGNAERPTFTPSVLVTSGHHVADSLSARVFGHAAAGACWCTYNADLLARGEQPSGFRCERCHSFITDGRVQYLGDCTHALAGQTVDLPPWPGVEK